ncbi:Transcriptional regulator of acetoin/glycerol metabolism [Marinobacterium stanieri]|uniref:Transcriptional regulator of acetoin/glycerol metabolism n=2 Tax=Marinobacterium stanieri TaxID=49186 RepID=A0A1N6NZ07_9GAMM|nr:Transcriptional regulator of acetoin/glycerol metabolism [Marinobacterium stanieri]
MGTDNSSHSQLMHHQGVGSASPPAIRGSWARCIDQYRLEPGRDLLPPRLSDAEVKQHRHELDSLLHAAEPVFQRLSRFGGGNGYCVLVTNRQGVVLRQYIDPQQGRELAEKELSVGTVWTENLVGTNGVGTCLATGEALTVHAAEHFGRELRNFSCSTAPLISPHGDMIGALDISTFAQENRTLVGLAQNLVCDSADQIEAAMFRYSFRAVHVFAVANHSQVSSEHCTALLACNDSGTLIGATTQALMLLGVAERALLMGQNLCSLAGVALDRALLKPNELEWASGSTAPLWLVPTAPKVVKTQDSSVPARTPETDHESTSLLDRLAGSDHRLRRNAHISRRVINRNINILLQGETGTGKEVWAKALHESSHRRDKPFVTLNCAAIPESLIESELFGYSAGTFTGALKGGKVGKVQASSGGTLFLDEIGDMPLALQARLLRVLAEGEITPLGEVQPVPLDLHVISATHRDLRQLVQEGQFREDLFYRISGVALELPGLRQRADKAALISQLVSELSDKAIELDAQAFDVLAQYGWPGNIRQLKSVLEFALCMCDSNVIRVEDLPEELMQSELQIQRQQRSHLSETQPLRHEPVVAGMASEQERNRILGALEENRWVVSRAATALGMSRSTLHRKIKKLGIR